MLYTLGFLIPEGLRIVLVSPGLYFVLWLDGCPDFSGRVYKAPEWKVGQQ